MLASTILSAALLWFGIAVIAGPAHADARVAAPVAGSSRAKIENTRATGEQLRDESRPRQMDAARPSETSAWDAVQVVVYKSKRLLAVYRRGVFEREFRVALGLVPKGRKRHANDARTPEGLYHVTRKRRHDRWQHFLALDYPNANDRERYDGEVRRGTIPDEDGKPFGIGGDIGIHGNDREKEQAAGVDWTKGCIALSAADIAMVAELVPVGASVWIVE